MTLALPPLFAEHSLVVVDVEGNGQQPPEIVEIAALRLTTERALTAIDLRSWLIRPERPIAAVVTRKVHGISNDDVAGRPTWAELADEIAGALDGQVLVAHNATVERRVLTAHLPGWNPPTVLDTLRLAKAIWPGLPGGYGLDNLIAHAGLDLTELGADTGSTRRHRAGADTWLTAALLLRLIEDGALTWDGLIAAAALPEPVRQEVPTEKDGLW